MKMLVVGGNGTIGKKVAAELRKKHQVIIVGRASGDIQVDIASSQSIKAMFESCARIDAIVSIAGDAKWAKFDELTEEDYYIGIKSKMMGQVNLTRIGRDYLNPNGSITLTTGILAEHPVVMTASAAMVNGAIHSFIKAAALEMKNGHRINVVASGLVQDSASKYKDYFPGHKIIPMSKVIDGYLKSIEGNLNGKIIRIYK